MSSVLPTAPSATEASSPGLTAAYRRGLTPLRRSMVGMAIRPSARLTAYGPGRAFRPVRPRRPASDEERPTADRAQRPQTNSGSPLPSSMMNPSRTPMLWQMSQVIPPHLLFSGLDLCPATATPPRRTAPAHADRAKPGHERGPGLSVTALVRARVPVSTIRAKRAVLTLGSEDAHSAGRLRRPKMGPALRAGPST